MRPGAIAPEGRGPSSPSTWRHAASAGARSRAERIGDLLLDTSMHAAAEAQCERLRADILERLDREPAAAATTPWREATPEPDPDRIALPTPLHPYFGSRYGRIALALDGPGRHFIRAPAAAPC